MSRIIKIIVEWNPYLKMIFGQNTCRATPLESKTNKENSYD
jgi:hypothetical protein